VQDEITATIVGAIEPELGKAERERAKRPNDLRAWDFYQRGLWHTYKRTREDLANAQHMFQRAIEIDPGLARAYAAAEEAFFFQFVGATLALGVPQRLRPCGLQRRQCNSTGRTHSTATLWGGR
jgi:adenylate cyclase